jgi:hypothetical protein
MKTDEFTTQLLTNLKQIFPPDSVKKEWNASKNSEDDFNNRDYYAPRVDIAIGPFNTNRDLGRNNIRFNSLIQENTPLLQKLYELSHLGEGHEYISFRDFISRLNLNPRCFIAIEIENTKDAKRSIGDIVNASVMGKVGIVIPIGEDKYRLFYKIKKYFHYLEQVGKLEGNFRNVLIIEGNKLLDAFPDLSTTN